MKYVAEQMIVEFLAQQEKSVVAVIQLDQMMEAIVLHQEDNSAQQVPNVVIAIQLDQTTEAIVLLQEDNSVQQVLNVLIQQLKLLVITLILVWLPQLQIIVMESIKLNRAMEVSASFQLLHV